MSKFTNAVATSHKLSLAAMEEASRYGLRTADLDHLFIALTIDAQLAGQVLRSLGVTLEEAREAVSHEHTQQLASLGIHTEGSNQGSIVFHETGGYEWSEPALEIIRRASKGEKRGDTAAVLRELVVEPSGTIEALLVRLGSSSSAVIAKLDEARGYPANITRQALNNPHLLGTSDAFIPTDPSQVFNLLRDPSRMPEWEPMIGTVEATPSNVRPGVTWQAHARTVRSDGKAIRVRPEFILQQIELVALEEPQLIEWRFTYPDAPNANAKRLSVELETAAGGTQTKITLAWEQNSKRRSHPVLRRILQPLTRFGLWTQLNQLGAGISRAFR